MNVMQRRAIWSLALFSVCLVPTTPLYATGPTITDIRIEGTNLVVTASVPPGATRNG